MRGSIGLVIGVAVGAGAMYLVLRPPWGSRATTVASSGPPVVVIGTDAGVPKPKPKRRRPNRVTPASPAAEEADGDEPAAPAIALTAADRAAEARGDEVALPPRTVDLASGDAARPLDDGEIRATLASQAGGVKDCVAHGAINTDLHATVTIKMLVDGRGRVTRSRIEAPRYLHEHGLLGCAQRALGRVRFPATGAATVVTLPITLE